MYKVLVGLLFVLAMSDNYLTEIAIQRGVTEANPLVLYILTVFGFTGLTLIKGGAILFLWLNATANKFILGLLSTVVLCYTYIVAFHLNHLFFL